ncbi:MAG: hypothetical protein Q7R33_01010 [Nitrosarchaeum sp.]|nr:hypothetical protein [Nitrosarchaeum sp.]
MRIISKFHDYYDCIQSYGFDPKIVYYRKTENIVDKSAIKVLKSVYMKFPSTGYYGSIPYYGSTLTYHPVLFIVSGKLYVSYEIDVGIGQRTEYVFDKTIIENFMSKSCSKKYRYNSLSDIRKLNQAYQELKNVDFNKVSIGLKTPVILMKHSYENEDRIVYVKDPFLKEYNFVKVLDPFTMYQTLSMFVGNFLIEQSKPIWPISDNLKAQSKGFDKYSFRKRK